MLLYHGTSAKYLEAILTNGVRPKGNGSGNWERFPSRQDTVYLTDSYAFDFAAARCNRHGRPPSPRRGTRHGQA